MSHFFDETEWENEDQFFDASSSKEVNIVFSPRKEVDTDENAESMTHIYPSVISSIDQWIATDAYFKKTGLVTNRLITKMRCNIAVNLRNQGIDMYPDEIIIEIN
jgi:hypothetical protein